MDYKIIDAQVSPTGRLEVLSRAEAAKLSDEGGGGLHTLYRNGKTVAGRGKGRRRPGQASPAVVRKRSR